MKRILMLIGTVLAFASCRATADTFTYVGSWEVDQGPSWTVAPPAYTGQQAAALLFGGTPSEYAISTNGTDPTDINFEDWVSTYFGACGGTFPCGTLSADNFVVTEDGHYDAGGDTSSYVENWAVGSQYVNYAFLETPVGTPEPGTWLLMGSGLLWLALLAKRRKPAALTPSAGSLT